MKSKRRILLITSKFPFLPGEYFLEAEFVYLKRRKDIELIILPSEYSRNLTNRYESENINLIFPRGRFHRYNVFLSIIKSIFSPLLYIEIYTYMSVNKSAKIIGLLDIVKSVVRFKLSWIETENLFKVNKELLRSVDVVYSYWNNVFSYSFSAYLKNRTNARLITRFHGADLYEERTSGCYFPLKRNSLSLYDEFHFLSFSAMNYAIARFHLDETRSYVSPLGIEVGNRNKSKLNTEGSTVIKVLSVSNVIGLKRVDLIIDSLKELSKINRDSITIDWTHVGDGSLLKEMEVYADNKFYGLPISWRFCGAVPNEYVRNIMDSGNFQVFINLSTFEGVPVSIMEAMSSGIPVVATNVGSVNELVSEETGRLLSADCSCEKVAAAIHDVILRNKDKSVSSKCISHIQSNFDAKYNFSSFYDGVFIRLT